MKSLKEYIRSSRIDYASSQLDEKTIHHNPFIQFEKWLQEAIDKKLPEPYAMILATASSKGLPSSRVLLLRDFNEKGFCFYSNYKSRKGKEIDKNPFAAITFFWQQLEKQVRIEGKLVKLSARESDNYFKSRPIESQLAAIASEQSKTIASREELNLKFQALIEKYKGKDIPRPKNWGGYCLIPVEIEFWQGRPNRLHDRILFSRKKASDKKWKIERLSP